MQEIINEYSEALFAVAKEKDEAEVFSESLSFLKELITENSEYTEFLFCTALPLSERLSAIDEAFEGKMPEEILSCLKILTENGRIRELPLLIDEFFSLKRDFENTKTVKVASSVALSNEQKDKLIKNLEKKYQAKIHAEYMVDESLIGGIKITFEDILIDGSIEKRLKDLKEVIKK